MFLLQSRSSIKYASKIERVAVLEGLRIFSKGKGLIQIGANKNISDRINQHPSEW